MEDEVASEAQALFDYDRQHFDELSFKTGDVIKVLTEIEGGWWHGELNGTKGWFPSNYVRKLVSRMADTSHLLTFQQEIVQHILEGESKQIADLNMLTRLLSPNVEILSKFSFMLKLPAFLDKIVQIIRLHESIEKALEKMKPLSQKKFVGKLFLDVAKTMDQIVGEYTRACVYIQAGLQQNSAAIPLAIGAAGHELYSSRTQTLFSSIFDRLERYPILLKETSRYYEDPHPDRSAIHQAMQIYSEIFHRCKLLRKLRKEDIEVLSSDIRGFSDQMRAQFADPTLTLRALLCSFGHDGKFLPEAAQPEAVVLLYPNSVIFLSVCSDSPKAYQFRMHAPLSNIAVTVSPDFADAITIRISNDAQTAAGKEAEAERDIHLLCTGACPRDLFHSKISEFIRNSKTPLRKGRTLSESERRPVNPTAAAAGGGKSTTGATLRNHSFKTVADVARRSDSCKSTSTDFDQVAGGDLASQRFSHSGPLQADHHGQDQVTSQSPRPEGSAGPPRTDTVAVTDLAKLPGCLFLPHGGCQGTTRAVVKWPDDILCLAGRQAALAGDRFGGLGNGGGGGILAQPPRIRLDCSALTSHWLPASSHAGRSAAACGTGDHGNRSSRPNSPGRTSGAGKVIRRRRTDRQKSAINVEDILRSTGRYHEATQNEGDAKIRQIVELYCFNGLLGAACKQLDQSQNRMTTASADHHHHHKENSLPAPSTDHHRHHHPHPMPPASTSAAPPRCGLATYENLDLPLQLPCPPPVVLPTCRKV